MWKPDNVDASEDPKPQPDGCERGQPAGPNGGAS